MCDLVDTRSSDCAGEREESRAGRLRRSGRSVSRPAVEQNRQQIHESLDVIDQRRFAEEAGLRWKGRLVAWFATLALDRVEKRRLFAADICARAATQLDREIPEQSRRSRMRDRAFEAP